MQGAPPTSLGAKLVFMETCERQLRVERTWSTKPLLPKLRVECQSRLGAQQPGHWFLGCKGLGKQQGKNVWVGELVSLRTTLLFFGAVMDARGSSSSSWCKTSLYKDLWETTWSSKNRKYNTAIAQTSSRVSKSAGAKQPGHWFLGGKSLGKQQGKNVWVGELIRLRTTILFFGGVTDAIVNNKIKNTVHPL